MTDPTNVNGDIQTLALDLDAITAAFVQGTLASRPGAGTDGQFYWATDTNELYYDNGSSWIPVGPATTRIGHTYSISGALNIASGSTGYIPPFFVPVPAAQTCIFRGVRAVVRSGSLQAQLTQNGSTISGLGAVTITTSATTTAPAVAPSVADGDQFGLLISSISGGPDGLSATFYFDITT